MSASGGGGAGGGTKLPIAVFISGGGTNLQALLDAAAAGRLQAEVRLVIASHAGAAGIERARAAGVAVRVLRSSEFASLEAFRREMMAALRRSGARLLVLAGYMKKLPPEVIRAFPDAILNVHPALLPKFGGRGYYGRRVHEAVLAAGETISGATVHIVNETYDEGPTLLQEEVPVLPGDTPDRLAERVLAVEHRILPEAVQAFAEGRMRVEGTRAWIVRGGEPPAEGDG